MATKTRNKAADVPITAEALPDAAASAGETAPPMPNPASVPPLDDLQHWTRVFGFAQQLVMERVAALGTLPDGIDEHYAASLARIAEVQAETGKVGMTWWQDLLAHSNLADRLPDPKDLAARSAQDKRFSDPEWRDNPVYALMLQTYLMMSDLLLGYADKVEGLSDHQKKQLRFATRNFIDAASPSNFALTNPGVVRRTIETRGENILKGLERMLADMERRQLSQTDTSAFVVGQNIASTPGKVIAETPLYQLIQYSPTTDEVLKTPLVIFPPWINRFYILDLTAEKSFVKWAVDRGMTVFIVSWKSADASMADVTWDDYVVRGQVQAIETVCDLLGVPSVHAIGYCVAGTTLAATLAWLKAQGRDNLVTSATFFTAQVDFSAAGDLTLFVDDQQIDTVERLCTDGFIDGRYLAATFNLLRSNDLIWSYVVNNYLMADDYQPFDLLFWNGDSTNLPARWFISYLRDLYRDNLLVQPGAVSIEGVPIDLANVRVPAFIQAGIDDHIAPARSVWKAMDHFTGPTRFVLAGSGHIAGVVNPPAKSKYQFWTCSDPVSDFDMFRERAVETKGSWWPEWFAWIESLNQEKVRATKARKPGRGKLPAIEDAPGSYVRMR